jgi:membrane protease YdiL (CAAX protease family)
MILARKRNAMLALLLLVPAPSIGIYLAAYGLPGTAFAKGFFFLCKVWLIALPLMWHYFIDKQPISIPHPSRKGMALATITGSIIFLSIGVSYFLVGHWVDTDLVSNKAAEVGLSSPMIYLLGALYWCTVNSLLEEYVWRWFVFTRCEDLMPKLYAVIASGLFFTIHHVIALTAYFDWRITILGSLGVFIGGATWSWIYLKYRNIYAAYLSHVFADVIIFWIGYKLIFGG